jgi:hypothetical protein
LALQLNHDDHIEWPRQRARGRETSEDLRALQRLLDDVPADRIGGDVADVLMPIAMQRETALHKRGVVPLHELNGRDRDIG